MFEKGKPLYMTRAEHNKTSMEGFLNLVPERVYCERLMQCLEMMEPLQEIEQSSKGLLLMAAGTLEQQQGCGRGTPLINI